MGHVHRLVLDTIRWANSVQRYYAKCVVCDVRIGQRVYMSETTADSVWCPTKFIIKEDPW